MTLLHPSNSSNNSSKPTLVCRTHFWQLWQILVAPLAWDNERQVVEQKSAGEPFLWKAVCPFIRFFLQWAQNMCEDGGLTMGSVCVSELSEYTDPILKSSFQHERNVSNGSGIQASFSETGPRPDPDWWCYILLYYTSSNRFSLWCSPGFPQLWNFLDIS